MASTYSTNLAIELIADGEQPGTWGQATNNNIGTLLEQAIVGKGAVSFATDANVTITITNGVSSPARCAYLSLTSAVSLTATRTLTVPSINKPYLIYNGTTGAQSITVTTGAGTTVTIPNGATRWVYCNGATGVTGPDYLALTGGTLTGPLLGTQIDATSGSVYRKNAIINGNFDIWQRGTSLAAASTARYLADRFFTSASGSTIAPSQQAFTLGQTAVPYEPKFYHRSVVVSAAGASNNAGKIYRVEDVRSFAGQKAMLSLYAKADAAKNMSVEFYQAFGTGGTPSAAVSAIGVTILALTTSWQRFLIPVTIPSIAGMTIGTNNDSYLQIQFWFDAGSTFNTRSGTLGQQSGTFDIAQVQLEPGSVATPFELRPAGAELALCKRYYEKGYAQGDTPGAAATLGSPPVYQVISTAVSGGAYNLHRIPFTVEKRAAAAVTLYSDHTPYAAGYMYDQDAAADVAAGVSSAASINNTHVYTTAAVTVGHYLRAYWTADAEL